MSSFQGLATAIAPGGHRNIVGASAPSSPRSGAIFWMWYHRLLRMAPSTPRHPGHQDPPC